MALLAINTKNISPSEYEGPTLLAVTEHNGVLYGITATELVEFTGTSDQGTDIDAYVQTGKISISEDETRYLRTYVKDQYANELTLTALADSVNADNESEETSVSYSALGGVGARQHAQTVRLRSDIKGTSWAWKLANVDGGGMSVRSWRVAPEGIEIDV